MISNKRLLYLGEKFGVHDQRFINALQLKFDVSTLFLEEAESDSYFRDSNFDVVIVSPISKQLLNFSIGINAVKIGICWAIEVNEVKYDESEIEQISRILNDFSLIIYDADHISNLIRTRFSYQGNLHKVYFGCSTKELAKIAKDREYSNIREICVTRNWGPLYRNELILDALLELGGVYQLGLTFTAFPPSNFFEIREKMRRSNIDIRFSGPLEFPELALRYQESDLYISAARSDGISVSLLEAMATGIICVVTDFSSNLEIIKSGINGFTFINGDAKSLSETIQKVLTLSPSERYKIGKAAQDFVLDKADWNKNKMFMLEKILDLVDVI